MYNVMIGFADDFARALKLSRETEIPEKVTINGETLDYTETPNEILICGMGGSSIGGEIVRDYSWDSLEIPLRVIQDFNPPASLNKHTLVFIVSYSGNTEETLYCLREALKRRARIVAITSNGSLKRLLAKTRIPFFKVPEGYPPRGAVAYLTIPILVTLEKIGLLGIPCNEYDETMQLLRDLKEKLSVETPINQNISKKLALELYDTLPFIYSYKPYSCIASRFKKQLNENSKIHAKFEELPELGHNEIMGWQYPSRLNNFLSVVFLRGRGEHPSIEARIKFISETLRENGVKTCEIKGLGYSKLANMMSLLYICDMASYYLAALRNVDPLPVSLISRMKTFVEEKAFNRNQLESEIRKLILQ